MDQLAAIVVTFHPDGDVVDNLAALRLEVERIVVVDNGSSAEELSLLREAQERLGFRLVENGENLGIATALNRGIEQAKEQGAEWVLLFDQDSRVTEGFAVAMLADFRASRWSSRLKVLVPRYVDMRSGERLPVPRGAEGLDLATTSGSLTPMTTFAEFGPFRDELFIDQVDYEFSLRVRAGGGVLDESTGATLLHSPGSPRPVRLGGRTLFASADYSPIRRYYQERNRIWMIRQFGRRFPGFAVRLALGSAKELVKMLAGERARGKKGRAFFAGVLDGLRGRMGKRKGS